MGNIMDVHELMQEYRSNPRKGFELLYHTLAGRLSSYLRRAFNIPETEILDIIHDAFIPWVESPERMCEVKNVQSYLFTTVRNLALKRKEKDARDHFSQEEYARRENPPSLTDAVERLEEALGCLPVEQKETVILRCNAGLSLEEVAAIQDVPVQTIASRYRYALQKLKEMLS
ncbi:MAG: RNA polymerase sigma factor [Candidatus Riflebacteria bacterium]|nr:RNA polymerase sigma factor [Candidatus Riflebacteria bacterium]